ncbi:MAG TPA: nucleotide exchange factor GrpE [Sphingopyxis sp.]|nr:nucleotide exchange factor GrpE [Sphingopyxis sp.]HMP46760.1 nucleotide exchange factor GrpE [Sphingopyxis sp.]HMQ18983.1 nucleotide exchange factor GrpE [Sphingopyxis sp.]
MTNIENDTPVEDEAPEAATAETPATEEQDEAAKLAEQIAALQQDLLYARAETQNVTRRKDKEIADAHAYAATRFARDILSVADNLGRALASLGEEQRENEAIKPLVTGLEATERELMSVFERHGITRIASVGLPLDPNQHQAMLEIPSDKEPGTIVQEMQAGYMMKDRLLRPAMVGVAKKAE